MTDEELREIVCRRQRRKDLLWRAAGWFPVAAILAAILFAVWRW